MVGEVFAAAIISSPGIMQTVRMNTRRQINRFCRLLPDLICINVRIRSLLSRFGFQIALQLNLLDGQLVKEGQNKIQKDSLARREIYQAFLGKGRSNNAIRADRIHAPDLISRTKTLRA